MHIEALLIDLDGTLYVGDEALPGAAEALRELQRLGVPRRFITNTTRYSRDDLVERLAGMGLEIDRAELFTAPLAACAYLLDRGIERISLHLPPSTLGEFDAFDLESDAPQAVVVGDLGAGWSFERMNRAFRDLLEGAELVALQKNRYWRSGDGLALDAGPFVVGLEYAASVEATVVGKPSARFFEQVRRDLDLPAERLAIVGDDLEADIGGGQAAGLTGIQVRTGKFRQETLEQSSITPDRIVDDFADAVRSLFG